MGWNTVDKSKSHEARGEDVERRELRLRRTYNEAASGHRLLAQNSAEAPPRAEIDALYWSVLEEVGTARSGKEEAWDGALRVACARHLSELREAGGGGDARSRPRASRRTRRRRTPGSGCGSTASRRDRRRAAKWPAYNRCRVAIEARRVEQLHGRSARAAAKVVARIPALVRRAYASLDVVAPPAPPRAARGLRREAGLLGLGEAVLSAARPPSTAGAARVAGGAAGLYHRLRRGAAEPVDVDQPVAERSASSEPSLSPSSLSARATGALAPAPPAPSPSGESPRPPEPPQIQDLWDAVLDDYVAEASAADDVDSRRRRRRRFAGDAVRRALDGQGAGADVVSVLCGTCGDRYARCDLALQVAVAPPPPRRRPVGGAALCRDRTAPRAASRAAARVAALAAAAGRRAPARADALRALAAGAAKADALAGHAAASEAVDAALAGALLRGADLDRRRGRPDGDVLDEAGAVAAALAALHPARLAPATRTVALAGAVDVLRKLDGGGARRRRPVDTRDTELFAAQCWYDFVGCRVLRDVANSRVDDKLRAKRLRL
ncbi:hypothetical protein JL722_1720 [Aureococcus anophagefferens]|nr:hypothetical protein JL722_1720 [Aureococcus anophagefferens]